MKDSSLKNHIPTEIVGEQLAETVALMQAVARDSAIHATLADAARATASALKAGHMLMAAGNGGSAADAQHLVAEFVSRLVENRAAMRAVALTTDTSIITAIGNDYGFERLFARQIEALGQPGDVFIAISTSGNSPNILGALELCRQMGIVTIGLTGRSGGKMPPLCDYCIQIPSDVTMHIQEAHLALEHIFCMITEQLYFATEDASASGTTAVRQA